MSRSPARPTEQRSRFPRVSGDEPLSAQEPMRFGKFSPRERG